MQIETRYVTLINLNKKKKKKKKNMKLFFNHYANVLKYVLLNLERNQQRGGSYLI